MTFRLYLSSLFILIAIFKLNAQVLKIFEIKSYEINKDKSIRFISLSDIYPLSEHNDSLAIPDLSEKEKKEAQLYKYIKLESRYRSNFLFKTNISETDKVFIYDYSKNVLKTFNVKDLEVVACLNFYGADWPYSQYDYMIGFEINKETFPGCDKYFNHFVYIGKDNPFLQEQLKNITWEKIEPENFPSNLISFKDTNYFKESEYVTGNRYKYETEDLSYFIEEIIDDNLGGYNVFAKRLLVFDTKTKDKVYETIYYSDEGSSLASIDNQWTGKLFKNKPTVIFGFKWQSFGCPSITLLSPTEIEIYINCDNRH